MFFEIIVTVQQVCTLAALTVSSLVTKKQLLILAFSLLFVNAGHALRL